MGGHRLMLMIMVWIELQIRKNVGLFCIRNYKKIYVTITSACEFHDLVILIRDHDEARDFLEVD